MASKTDTDRLIDETAAEPSEPRWDDWTPIGGEGAYCSSTYRSHPDQPRDDMAVWHQLGEIDGRRARATWICEIDWDEDGMWGGEPDWDAEPDTIEWVEG